MRKRIIGAVLLVCMILSYIPVTSFADDPFVSNPCYIELGVPEKHDNGTTSTFYTFPRMQLRNTSGNPIKYVSIAFSSAKEDGDSINLDENETFSVDKSVATSYTIKAKDGQTPTNEDWLDFLKTNLSVTLTSSSIEYSITATCSDDDRFGAEVDGYLYRASTGHYYRFVSVPSISWSDAYNAAKDPANKLLGMQGYLVTITSQEEMDYISKIISAPGWIGGTRNSSHYPTDKVTDTTKQLNRENLASIGITGTGGADAVQQKLQANDAWFWADGAKDEAGLIFYPYSISNTNANNYPVYSNWVATQPDNSQDKEPYAHSYANGRWNDWPLSFAGTSSNSGIKGYIVEYGGKEDNLKLEGKRTSAYISPAQVANPTITSKFNENAGADCITTFNGETITPHSFTLKQWIDNSYKEVKGPQGVGEYQMVATYTDADGNSYYSEKNAKIEAVKLQVQLKGLDTFPADYPGGVKEIPLDPGSSYVAKAPVIEDYTVDVSEQSVNNLRSSKAIVFTYTKKQNCNVKVVLDGLDAVPDGSWTADGSTFTKTLPAKKGGSLTATAPVVAGYLVDRYSATLDPVAGGETITFHYVKEGAGSTARTVAVQLKDTNGKTLSADGYATKYVVETGNPMTIVAPTIPGYTFQSGSYTPEADGCTLTGGTFKAAAVEQNTTVTFVYEKLPEHTVTVQLAGLDEMPSGYPKTATVTEGDSYTAVAPQIEGYTVDKTVETLANVTQNETITFTYTKRESADICKVTVELVDKTDTANQKTITPPAGFVSEYYITKGGGYTLTHPVLDGYNYTPPDENAAIAPLDGDKTVKFFYTKEVTHTVTVKLEGANLSGYPLKIEVPHDGSYTAIAPLIDGKKADHYSEDLTNITDDIIVTFKYESLPGFPTPTPAPKPEKSPVGDVLNAEDHIAYMFGHANGLFEPEGDLTRAQCAQIFYNLLLDRNAEVTTTFWDVLESAWYAPAVNTLASMGVLRGYTDGSFQPEESITRAEFTAIAMRFGALDKTGENPFVDVDAGKWYYDDVVGSAKYGWICGYEDGTFRPEENISRTEVTYIVNRMLNRAADTAFISANPAQLASFPDLQSSYWGYDSIMEATNAHDYKRAAQKEVWKTLRING